MPGRKRKGSTIKEKQKKKIRDPTFRKYLDDLRASVQVQNESDKDFVDQANKLFRHRNVDSGYGDPVVDDDTGPVRELPTIRHRHMEEFAFRYAMEPRNIAYWADTFGVSVNSIKNWLKRKDVSKYIAALRRHRYLIYAHKRMQIETETLDLILKLIRHPLSDDNFESKRRLAMELISLDPSAHRSLTARLTGNSKKLPDLLPSPSKRLSPSRSSGSVEVSEIDDDEIEAAISVVEDNQTDEE